MTSQSSERFGEPALLLLVSLASGPKHGYAMIEDIESFAGVRLGPGTLYGAIERLEGNGLIEPLESPDRRRPYRLTQAGAAALRRQLTGLRRVSRAARQRLAS
jgi:DNA-binding PadR family transcriptional regulator